MEMKQEELEGGIHKVTLSGSLDIAGASEIDLPFSVVAGKYDRVMVDLDGVTFLASMGVRVLVKAAKSQASHGGKMVLLNPTPPARRVLESIGVDSIIPIVDSEAEAIEKLS